MSLKLELLFYGFGPFFRIINCSEPAFKGKYSTETEISGYYLIEQVLERSNVNGGQLIKDRLEVNSELPAELCDRDELLVEKNTAAVVCKELAHNTHVLGRLALTLGLNVLVQVKAHLTDQFDLACIVQLG